MNQREHSPETVFLSWLAARPDLVDSLLPRLPLDTILSPEGRHAVIQITQGTWQQNGVPPNEPAALEFLNRQLLGLIGREAAKAQQTGQMSRVEWATALLRECQNGGESLPLAAYHEVVPQIREVIPTGIELLDRQIRGLAQGELGILAAPPGKGKSLFLINLAVSAALDNRTVLYISVADAGIDELIPRIDTCILNEVGQTDATQDILAERHRRATASIPGRIWIADFTDKECTLASVEQTIEACESDLVVIDHADDILPPWNDPAATRHGLRVIYLALKKLAVRFQTAIWTASQTHEASWFLKQTGISSLAEAKTGKATGAALVLVFSAGPEPVPGIVLCSIAKARRFYTESVVPLRYSYELTRIWTFLISIFSTFSLLSDVVI